MVEASERAPDLAAMRLRRAAHLAFFIAVLNIAAGIAVVAMAKGAPPWTQFAYSLAFGAGFAAVGVFVRGGAGWPLPLAVVLLVVDGLLSVRNVTNAGGGVPYAGVVVRVFFVVTFTRAFLAQRARDG